MPNKGFTLYIIFQRFQRFCVFSKKKRTGSCITGFTIIEVILAIFILTTVIGSSFALIQQTTSGAFLNQSKLIAYYLAQEGVENIRNIRDTNWLEAKDWKEGIVDSEESINFLDESQSRFERRVIVEEKNDGDNDYLEIKVIVEWSERRREHKVEVINHLYNWY